jgi:hypothetical protein
MYVYVCMYMYVCMYVCMYVYIYIYIFIYVCMYVYIYIYILKQVVLNTVALFFSFSFLAPYYVTLFVVTDCCYCVGVLILRYVT